MSKKFINWRDLLFIAVGAIIATIGNNWTYFVFDPQISLSDLLIAVLGGFLGLYIGSKLNSEHSSERIEKDLLISEISPLKVQLTKLYNLIETNLLPLNDAVQIFKSASQSILGIRTMAKLCKDDKVIDDLNLELLKKIRDLNALVTAYPVGHASVITIPPSDIPDLLRQTRVINEKITALIITINRR